MSFVVRLRQRTSGQVSVAMVLWALAMMVVLVRWELQPADEFRTYALGALASALLGVYLGWRRRVAAALVAPLVGWVFAWLPLWVAAIIRHGFIKGFFVGAFLITLGWLVIGTVEVMGIGFVALVVRLARGGPEHDGDITIIGPGERF